MYRMEPCQWRHRKYKLKLNDSSETHHYILVNFGDKAVNKTSCFRLIKRQADITSTVVLEHST